MRMSSLKAAQGILLINWIIAPALAIWIWVTAAFLSAVAFVAIWLIADKVWDKLTEHLIAAAYRMAANESEAVQIQLTGEVPGRMASMMILDLCGTALLPWLVAAVFLGWV